jgi:hypothetical protein
LLPLNTQSVLIWIMRAPAARHSSASRCGKSELTPMLRIGSFASRSCLMIPMQFTTTCGRVSVTARTTLSKSSAFTPAMVRERSRYMGKVVQGPSARRKVANTANRWEST